MKWLLYSVAINIEAKHLVDNMRRQAFEGDIVVMTNGRSLPGTETVFITSRDFCGYLPFMDRLRTEIFSRYDKANSYDWLMFLEMDCIVYQGLDTIVRVAEESGKLLVEKRLVSGELKAGAGILIVPNVPLGRSFLKRFCEGIGRVSLGPVLNGLLADAEFRDKWDYVPGSSRWCDEPEAEATSTIVHYAGSSDAKARFRAKVLEESG